LVGLARALEIASFDNPISASQALEWGLVTKIAADDKVQNEALAMLDGLLQTSLHSFAWSKRLFLESFNNTLETQLELERQGISDCAGHPDGQEGVRAFMEKRKPVF
jgi:2-(1,2-epoxy-1,2-dihydrophenyl)acetyl-CoA isomerase